MLGRNAIAFLPKQASDKSDTYENWLKFKDLQALNRIFGVNICFMSCDVDTRIKNLIYESQKLIYESKT
ncbi:MAG: hypothetical protein RMY34_04990 [Aulosira sp. DedQUE10]|nr:hypothetical protein [Aulosira sp. DedQUE10]